MALQIISAADRLENVDLSSLASVFVGSSAITPGQKQKLFEVLASRGALTGQQDGSAIFDGYGMSEVFSLALACFPPLYLSMQTRLLTFFFPLVGIR
jgi:acyl-CoA synthetase (AMP-forming)/AMP-acid ligase II